MGRSNKTPQTHYIIVAGGVISGSGKGIVAASIGAILKARGLTVNIQKFDMYYNVDAGTLRPGEHGEVFVTDDGAETDLDIGHYERFLDQNFSQKNSVMQGQILLDVLKKERQGFYEGHNVQVVPHITGAIIDRIKEAGKGFEVLVVELGGTVGDYEGVAFYEAVRQLSDNVGADFVKYVYVVYLMFLPTSQEIKTKPAQNAIRTLLSIGINPDVLIGRCSIPVGEPIVEKLNRASGIGIDNIVMLEDLDLIYKVPLVLEESGLGRRFANWLNCRTKPAMQDWNRLVRKYSHRKTQTIRIALIAKYLSNKDTYYSITESLKIAAWHCDLDLKLDWVSATRLEEQTESTAVTMLMRYDGILVPGGFGVRGVEGMIRAAQYSLTSNTPYLGICLGMQVLVIALSRLRTDLKQAHSREFQQKGKQLVIDYSAGQTGKELTGGTMRLGNYRCRLVEKTLAARIYDNQPEIITRHRHRFEFNDDYRDQLQKSGLVISGVCPDNGLVEMVEISDQDYAIGCQFHPEFKTRPNSPEPLFTSFLNAASKSARSKK